MNPGGPSVNQSLLVKHSRAPWRFVACVVHRTLFIFRRVSGDSSNCFKYRILRVWSCARTAAKSSVIWPTGHSKEAWAIFFATQLRPSTELFCWMFVSSFQSRWLYRADDAVLQTVTFLGFTGLQTVTFLGTIGSRWSVRKNKAALLVERPTKPKVLSEQKFLRVGFFPCPPQTGTTITCSTWIQTIQSIQQFFWISYGTTSHLGLTKTNAKKMLNDKRIKYWRGQILPLNSDHLD